MKLRNYIATLCALASLSSSAQDLSLSQAWNMPMLGNPAMTGSFDTDYRAGLSHRSQWASIGDAFKTSTAMGEAKLLQNKSGFMGVGAFIHQGKAGTSKLGTFEAIGTASYNLKVGAKDFFSTGLALGYRQRSIAIDGLKWDSQFNGIGHDPSISSGENFANQQSSSIDAGIGLFWKHRKKQYYDIGYAAWHYFQDQGFLSDTSDPTLLRQQFNFNWIKNYGPVEIVYSLTATKQGGAFTGLVGLRGKYRVGSDSRYTTAQTSSAFIAGIYYRNADAIIPMIGYEFERKIQCFVSYDITVSTLSESNLRRGGWEISLVWSDFYSDSRRRLK
ncbi:MAG: type IX secretion system PorP/SprF family membrane protein [Flavobacteriales bacterium]|jgi:type IX secretion system PorP/SprF family membrane protein